MRRRILACQSKTIKGLCCAPFTPMHDDHNTSLNVQMISKQYQDLIDAKVTSVFVNGTNGESVLLTVDERKEVAAKWVQVSKDNPTFNVIVQVGTQNLYEAKDLAAHAQEIGADAIAAMPPCLFKPFTTNALIQWCQDIAFEASALPFYYYHFPPFTGVETDCVEFMREADGRIPTLTGMKFTDYHLHTFQQLAGLEEEKWNIFYSREEQLLPALALGANAFIAAHLNYVPNVFNRLIAAFEANDLETARMEQFRLVQLARIVTAFPESSPVGVAKNIMKLNGTNVGPPRQPMERLSAAKEEKLETELKKIGFFDWN